MALTCSDIDLNILSNLNCIILFSSSCRSLTGALSFLRSHALLDSLNDLCALSRHFLAPLGIDEDVVIIVFSNDCALLRLLIVVLQVSDHSFNRLLWVSYLEVRGSVGPEENASTVHIRMELFALLDGLGACNLIIVPRSLVALHAATELLALALTAQERRDVFVFDVLE